MNELCGRVRFVAHRPWNGPDGPSSRQKRRSGRTSRTARASSPLWGQGPSPTQCRATPEMGRPPDPGRGDGDWAGGRPDFV